MFSITGAMMVQFDITKELIAFRRLLNYMKIFNIKQSSINEAITGTGFHGGTESNTRHAEQLLAKIEGLGMKTEPSLKMTFEWFYLSGS